MHRLFSLCCLLLSLYLGGCMLYGGWQKFAKPLPDPLKMIQTIEAEGSASLQADLPTLRIKNYLFGMKQTGYFWPLLGGCELLFGLMILSQYLRLVGAAMLLPITLHILLFHVFLEPTDVFELVNVVVLFGANVCLIAHAFPRWKSLLWFRPAFF